MSDTPQKTIPKEAATFFATQNDFRAWLECNYETATELIVGYYKVDSGKPSMTWSQSVDQALCFGWIDGIRRSIDFESYCIRFTPRRSSSVWSAINIRKVAEMTKAGLMKPAGLKAFNQRKESKSVVYSYEIEPAFEGSVYEHQFMENKKAWETFTKKSNSFRKTVTHWIMSAKQEKTRQSRLKQVIEDCEK